MKDHSTSPHCPPQLSWLTSEYLVTDVTRCGKPVGCLQEHVAPLSSLTSPTTSWLLSSSATPSSSMPWLLSRARGRKAGRQSHVTTARCGDLLLSGTSYRHSTRATSASIWIVQGDGVKWSHIISTSARTYIYNTSLKSGESVFLMRTKSPVLMRRLSRAKEEKWTWSWGPALPGATGSLVQLNLGRCWTAALKYLLRVIVCFAGFWNMEILSDDPRTEDIHCAYVVCCSERGIIQQVLSSLLPVMQRRRYLQMTFILCTYKKEGRRGLFTKYMIASMYEELRIFHVHCVCYACMDYMLCMYIVQLASL